MNDILYAYAFTIKDLTKLNDLLGEVQFYFRKSSILRERLMDRKLSKITDSIKLDSDDISGRIFCKKGEFRYKQEENGYKCLLVCNKMDDLLKEIVYQECSVKLTTTKHYFLTSLHALLDTDYNDTVKVVIQEFDFKDGGQGSYIVDYYS